MTPEGKLYHAVKNGDLTAAKAALRDVASAEMTCSDGKPLLWMAAKRGQRATCNWLIENGANINAAHGARKYSLLLHAAASHNFGLASMLLDLGAYASPLASNNATPLHIAARTGQPYLANKLIGNGATLDAIDTSGRTPLHWAVEKEDTEIAKLLVNNGCDVNCTDRRSRSALSIAIANGNDEIQNLLLSHGTHVLNPLIASTSSTRYSIDLPVCLLYTSPSPRDQRGSRMPSSA